jgi:hypothetical protein
MRKNVIILALALLALVSACSRGRMEPSREIDVQGLFAVAIPGNLVPCNELHDFAPLQYADERGGYFLVGIQEAKQDIAHLKVKYQLADYASFVENTIGSAFDTLHVAARDTMEVNGLRCQTADLYASITDPQSPLEVYYHLSVFESQDHFYQLIGWSRRDRQEAFHVAAVDIDQSFHELAGKLAQGKPLARPSGIEP